VRDYYIDSLLVSAVIRRSSQVTGELSKSDLIQALSSGTGHDRSRPGVRRLYWIAAILLLGALIVASLTLFRHKDQGPAIGSLAGAYEAQWRGLIRVRASRCTSVHTICARVWRRWIWTRGRASCSKLPARSN